LKTKFIDKLSLRLEMAAKLLLIVFVGWKVSFFKKMSFFGSGCQNKKLVSLFYNEVS